MADTAVMIPSDLATELDALASAAERPRAELVAEATEIALPAVGGDLEQRTVHALSFRMRVRPFAPR